MTLRLILGILVGVASTVAAQEVPVDQILTQQNVAVIFNAQSMNIQANTCVQDAAWNAGVAIR